jgi:hypothetical protein
MTYREWVFLMRLLLVALVFSSAVFGFMLGILVP